MVQADQDSAKVTFPPPLMLILSLLIGIGLQFQHPFHISQNLHFGWIGYSMTAIGILTIIYCRYLFKNAKTDIKPWKTTSKIVQGGPYRFSRNPIYLSLIIMGVGVALSTNNGWILITQGILLIILDRTVISKEEKYLELKFGETYRAYKFTTRRWF